ncbi:DUF551 domain-containing protein [Klebsiella quasipneumoniae]|uniref:DUF551 domain-containing protein n=1 Tax=Klebsiella quasipneumoniae TaxID=1463165 RepID=UPI000808AA4C|nr:DUF551 domain-containing protein [Klebsiella quasipneumoniae]SCA37563.1 Eaa1 [Klebsiella quasipneumoniae]SCA38053.1 Eaa1 [Klebsiella quasipneumoniae]
MTSKLTRLTDDELTETLRQATSGYPLPASVEGNLRHAFAELQERRKADSEPVVYASEETLAYAAHGELLVKVLSQPAGDAIIPLYRHAQPIPVVDSEPVAYIFKHPAGRLFWALTDESNKGQSDVMPVYATPRPAPVVLKDHEIRELVNQLRDIAIKYHGTGQLRERIAHVIRGAMLQAGNSPVIPDGYRLQPISEYEAMCATVNSDEWPQRWIPVSERMPERGDYLVTDGRDFDVQSFDGEQFIPGFVWEDAITHWMPLPAAPQEVK